MCGFTHATYKRCNHIVLLTDPIHTYLCLKAKLIEMVQGTNEAPAFCHPLSDTENPIATETTIYDYCDQCKAARNANLGSTNDNPTKPLKSTHQITKHTPEPDPYHQHDINTVTSLRTSLTTAEKLLAKKTIRDFNDLLTANKIPHTINPILLQPRDEKFEHLFGPAFRRCSAWLAILEACIAQEVPLHIARDLLCAVEDQMEKFCQRVAYLDQLVKGVQDREVRMTTYNSAWRRKLGDKLFEEGIVYISESICDIEDERAVLGHPDMEDLDDEGLAGKYAAKEVERVEEMERIRREDGKKGRKCGAMGIKLALRQDDFMKPAGIKLAEYPEKFRAKVPERTERSRSWRSCWMRNRLGYFE